MSDTDGLRSYRRSATPTIPGSEQRYLAEELSKIETTLNGLVVAVRKIEARMIAHGF